jgi:hypothetical protein
MSWLSERTGIHIGSGPKMPKLTPPPNIANGTASPEEVAAWNDMVAKVTKTIGSARSLNQASIDAALTGIGGEALGGLGVVGAGGTGGTIRDAIMQRVVGSAVPGSGTDTSGPNTPGNENGGGWLGTILDDIDKYQKPLSLLGQVAGGVEKMRTDAADQKARQRQLDIEQGYYDLAAKRAQATHDAYTQLYAQNKYYGPSGSARTGVAGTGSAGVGSAGAGAPNNPSSATPPNPQAGQSMSRVPSPSAPQGMSMQRRPGDPNDPNDPNDPTQRSPLANAILSRLGYVQPMGQFAAPRFGSSDYIGGYGG